jgi:hypothetical protein
MRRSLACLLLLSAAVPAHRGSANAAPIFRCEREGVVVFADQPCGSDAKAYEPDRARVTIYEATPTAATPSVRSSRTKPKAKSTSIAGEQLKHAEQCTRLQQSSREVKDKFRSGYTTKEGERLRVRQDKLKQQLKTLRCR